MTRQVCGALVLFLLGHCCSPSSEPLNSWVKFISWCLLLSLGRRQLLQVQRKAMGPGFGFCLTNVLSSSGGCDGCGLLWLLQGDTCVGAQLFL